MSRREDAERNTNERSNDQRVSRNQDCIRQALLDQIENRRAGQQGLTEVTSHGVPQPHAVLHDQWLIESVELTDFFDALFRGVITRQRDRRIAGDKLQQVKHHESGEYDDRQQLPQTAADQCGQTMHLRVYPTERHDSET